MVTFVRDYQLYRHLFPYALRPSTFPVMIVVLCMPSLHRHCYLTFMFMPVTTFCFPSEFSSSLTVHIGFAIDFSLFCRCSSPPFQSRQHVGLAFMPMYDVCSGVTSLCKCLSFTRFMVPEPHVSHIPSSTSAPQQALSQEASSRRIT